MKVLSRGFQQLQWPEPSSALLPVGPAGAGGRDGGGWLALVSAADVPFVPLTVWVVCGRWVTGAYTGSADGCDAAVVELGPAPRAM